MLVTLVEVEEVVEVLKVEVVEVGVVVRHLIRQVLACWIPEFKLPESEFESGVAEFT